MVGPGRQSQGEDDLYRVGAMMGSESLVGKGQEGFSLVELLVSMLIAMVILAGITANFISQSNVTRTQASRATTLEDLELAARIIRGELLVAKASGVRLDPGVSAGEVKLIYDTVDSYSGAFWYNHPQTAGGMLGAGSLCWLRPAATLPASCTGNDELLRGLDPVNGFQAVQDPYGGWKVTLSAAYLGVNKQPKHVSLSFVVAPRNP